MLTVTCAGCSKSLSVDDTSTAQATCPDCGRAVPIPVMRTTVLDADSRDGTGELTNPPAKIPGVGFADSIVCSSDSDTIAISASAKREQSPKEFLDFLAPAQAPGELGWLGSYRVLKILGVGGMGVVFKAEDPHLERTVALKAMRPSVAQNPAARQRFLREAKAAAAIKHDHIVTIFQVGEHAGAPYLAMEFLEGESLDERLAREKILPFHEALRITRETAEGLGAAHARGLIHRDIKPENIWLETKEAGVRKQEPGAQNRDSLLTPDSCLLTPSFRVKIVDFGLARAASEETQVTQEGCIIGTPAYMSPEQARSQPLDNRCDLFSLGSVLYRMVTGALPFKAPDAMSTLVAVVNDAPTPPRELNPKVPAPLSDLISRLLSKDRKDRPASAPALIQAIQEIERSLPTEPDADMPAAPSTSLPTAQIVATAVMTATPVTTVVTTKRPPRRLNPAIAFGILAAAIGIGVYLSLPQPTVRVDETWLKQVAAMKPEGQVKAIADMLRELNPGFDGRFEHKIESGAVTSIHFNSDLVEDIAPLQILTRLTSLSCAGGAGKGILADLTPLAELNLTHLDCHDTQVYDLTPLRNMDLRNLDCHDTAVYDLYPLKAMKLETLNCSGTRVNDLAPLKGMALSSLDCAGTPVSELAPLEGMRRLESLNVARTRVAELWRLERTGITFLNCAASRVTDLTPLAKLRLEEIHCDVTSQRDRDALKAIPTLRMINGMPAAEWWSKGER